MRADLIVFGLLLPLGAVVVVALLREARRMGRDTAAMYALIPGGHEPRVAGRVAASWADPRVVGREGRGSAPATFPADVEVAT